MAYRRALLIDSTPIYIPNFIEIGQKISKVTSQFYCCITNRAHIDHEGTNKQIISLVVKHGKMISALLCALFTISLMWYCGIACYSNSKIFALQMLNCFVN